MQKEEITLKTLADNEDVKVGYRDNDIVFVDSIQKFVELNAAHMTMNGIIFCTSGRIQGKMNGRTIIMHENQIAFMPQNVTITDMMISPDFGMNALFLTNNVLQNFLREKISVWNDIVYIHHHHIITASADDMRFYTNFYEMLTLCVSKGTGNPFYNDIVLSLLRSAVLGLCGRLKTVLSTADSPQDRRADNRHFEHFLNLLNSTEVRHRTVDSYAKELCITPKYLSAVCKRNSGKTANEWIREHVMEDIRFYLKQTDMSMKEVSNRLGFPNSSFFGKYVREHFGMTPLQLRRS